MNYQGKPKRTYNNLENNSYHANSYQSSANDNHSYQQQRSSQQQYGSG
jgi:hypothetical protein